MALLATVGVGIFWTVWSVFLDSFVHNPKTTGLYSALLASMGIIFSLLTPAFSKIKNKNILIMGLLLNAVTVTVLGFSKNILVVLIIGLIMFLSVVLRNLGLSIMTRNSSRDETLSQNEGSRWVLMNIGYLIAPLIVSVLFVGNNFEQLFLISGIFLLLSSVLAYLLLPKGEYEKVPIHPLRYFKEYWSDKKRTVSFVLRMMLSCYYGYVYTFVPLLIVYQGLPPELIGIFFLLFVIPLIILEFPVSKLAKRRFKTVFVTGLLLMIIMMLISGIIENPLLSLSMIIASASGAAFLEPTVEAYFFSGTKKGEQLKFLGTYFTGDRSGRVLGRLLGPLLLFVLPLEKLAMGYAIILIPILIFIIKSK